MLRYPSLVSLNICRRLYSTQLSLNVKETLTRKPIDQKILVQGWVQTVRKHKKSCFVDLIDGTCLELLQEFSLILANSKASLAKGIGLFEEGNKKFFCGLPQYGSSIKVEGSLIKSKYQGQEVELIADTWKTIGACAEDYPFQYRTKYTSEHIRQYPYLRPRTRRFSSILRVRNHASMAVHKYFQDKGYCFIHTPIITQNDCEGAGEVFSVELKEKVKATPSNTTENKNTSDEIKVLKDENLTNNATLSNEESSEKFFGAPAFLTVSGQLHLEAIASSFGGGVYNFGPTFRAESSRTRLHACEFQMIEAEIAFITSLEDLFKAVENCIKEIIENITQNCVNEIQFLSQDLKNHDTYINNLLSKPFVQMSYEESISILQKSKDPIKFGEDLSAKHKISLIKHCDNIPVFAYCFDLFASYGGEICGGSLREEDVEKLRAKYAFDENSSLSWYLDLRKYGCPPHGGFGIGFERLLQSILGISNIRDIVPFPRRKYDCKC
ncbi:hypothetical protein JTE90_016940 [Oedothorax gibbosus]|uniref:Aminoacyl-transfer RNA synthetases class-II family profile domain-containing protein n=1 Tax=Oedothorax gibbosus TaxID=931172 RepID=A0AAV6UVV9_9ARAC|nr:hypothetical protein JTE90_016940 [Oedothorax gibbosus]